MAKAVLSRILAEEAKAALSPELQAALWEQVGTQLGFAPAAIAAALPAATAPPPPGGLPPVPAAGALSGPLTATIATVTATAVLAAGGYGIYQLVKGDGAAPPEQPPAISESLPDPTPSQPDDTPVLPEESSTSGDASPPASSSQADSSGASQAQPKSSVPESSVPPEPEASSQPEESQPAEAAQGQDGVQLTVSNFVITYSVGGTASDAQIISDAGASLSGEGSIVATHVDQIDFSTPGEYGIYLHGVDNQGNESPRIAVIVIIE
ncbi:MAG: hypothetical protein ACK5LX_12940 [Oscillospiraceae bacterium]